MKANREATIILVIGLGILLASLFANTIGIGDDPASAGNRLSAPPWASSSPVRVSF